jgi:hypothetical protein
LTPRFGTALNASPVGAPLVAAPAFTPPSTAGAVTVNPAAKPKHKAKPKKKKIKRRGKKASRASRRNGNQRSGR